MRTPGRTLAALLTVAVALCGATAASAQSALHEETVGTVRYVSGGIGADEDAAMRALMPAYPLVFTFLEQDGGADVYMADVPLTLRNLHGDAVLDVRTGPFLLVRLPAGQYSASASFHGQVQERHFKVEADTTTRVTFVWPTAAPAPAPPTAAPAPPAPH